MKPDALTNISKLNLIVMCHKTLNIYVHLICFRSGDYFSHKKIW